MKENELTPNSESTRGWHVNDKHRNFPPSGNRKALINVLIGYERLSNEDEEPIAPWMKTYTPEEAFALEEAFSLESNKFQESIKTFNQMLGVQTTLLQGVINAEHKLDSVRQIPSIEGDKWFRGASWDAKVILMNRTFKDLHEARYYMDHVNELPENLQRLIKAGKNYLSWEAQRGKKEFKNFPNPWEHLVNMFNVGMHNYTIDPSTDKMETHVLMKG